MLLTAVAATTVIFAENYATTFCTATHQVLVLAFPLFLSYIRSQEARMLLFCTPWFFSSLFCVDLDVVIVYSGETAN